MSWTGAPRRPVPVAAVIPCRLPATAPGLEACDGIAGWMGSPVSGRERVLFRPDRRWGGRKNGGTGPAWIFRFACRPAQPRYTRWWGIPAGD